MSNLKPSLIATLGQNLEDLEHTLEEVKTENSIGDEFGQLENARHEVPILRLDTDEFNEEMGISKDDSPVDKESVLKSSNYAGFTIALKEEKEEVQHLSLSRGPVTKNLKTLLVVDKDDHKAKDVQPLDFFSKTEVLRPTALEPDPNSKADDVWTGLEVVTRKGDEDVKYYLMSHGFGEWKVLDQTEESKGDSDSWFVESAEIIRVKEKGPYIRLLIDEEHSVFFYPIIPDQLLERMHRFITQ